MSDWSIFERLREQLGLKKARAQWSARFGRPCPFYGSPMDAAQVTIDFETSSECDLMQCGSWVYAEHPSTRVNVMAWSVNGMLPDVVIWQRSATVEMPEALAELVAAGAVLYAHNAEFEINLWRRLGWEPLPLCRWRCTAAMARAMALPGALGKAGAALGLSEVKDEEGSRLMKVLCRPGVNKSWAHHTPDLMAKLAEYCKQDVRAEDALRQKLLPLSPAEQRVWELTCLANQRGLPLDTEGVAKCLATLATAEAYWTEVLAALPVAGPEASDQTTLGFYRPDALGLTAADAKCPDRWVTWMRAHGVPVPDATDRTVQGLLGNKDPAVRAMAQARRDLARGSTGKIESLTDWQAGDGRAHGCLIYHGATTGRWAAEGPQPHNLPKACHKDPDAALGAMDEGPAWLDTLYGGPVQAVAGCLRAMIQAPGGRVLMANDAAQIEARVIMWLASDPGLELFAQGVDVYRELAGLVFGMDPASIPKDSMERGLGKEGTLACGFGMGAAKFLARLLSRDIPCTEDLAQRVVKGYREKFARVPLLWKSVESAAMMAMKNPGQVQSCDRLLYRFRPPHLFARLPSGRILTYPFAELQEGTWADGRPKQELAFRSQLVVEGRSTKVWGWERTWGGTLAQNATQAIARDILAEAWQRAEDAGFPIILTVHDELLCEVDEDKADFARFTEVCEQLPAWAAGLPVKFEGWTGRRYRK